MSNKNNSSNIYESLGKLCVFSAFASSVMFIAAAFIARNDQKNYQNRLRKAYEGLSPEDCQSIE
ncbi:hypothetical protein [Endomicrobium proavitum]|uniref:hypothetical protein n=1 Tax=Endomicrobium proavitum TaxID=1408281 RepID=UPI0006987011|nr:hypothetical protein [Endomicrobium proavitum]